MSGSPARVWFSTNTIEICQRCDQRAGERVKLGLVEPHLHTYDATLCHNCVLDVLSMVGLALRPKHG